MTQVASTSAVVDIWNEDDPFPYRPQPAARTRKKSTEAEIVLSEQVFAPDSTTELALSRSAALSGVAVDATQKFPANEPDSAAQQKDDFMADTKEKKTKAAYIREEIAAAHSKTNDKIRPRDIIAKLASRGIAVTAPQVSVAVRDFMAEAGETPPKRANSAPPAAAAKVAAAVASARGKATTATATKATTRRRAASKVALPDAPAVGGSAAALASDSAHRMSVAESFINEAGGLNRARALLDAYESFQRALAPSN